MAVYLKKKSRSGLEVVKTDFEKLDRKRQELIDYQQSLIKPKPSLFKSGVYLGNKLISGAKTGLQSALIGVPHKDDIGVNKLPQVYNPTNVTQSNIATQKPTLQAVNPLSASLGGNKQLQQPPKVFPNFQDTMTPKLPQQTYKEKLNYMQDQRKILNKMLQEDANLDKDVSGNLRLAGAVAGAIGGMAPKIAVSTLGTPLAGLALTYAGGSGSGVNKALNEGATLKQAKQYGVASGLTQAGTESLFSVAGMGKGIVSEILKKKAPDLTFGIMQKTIGKVLSTETGRVLVDTLGEGAEEVVEDVLDHFAQRIYKSDKDIGSLADKLPEMATSFLVGTLTAGFINTGRTGIALKTDIQNSVKYLRAKDKLNITAGSLEAALVKKNSKNVETAPQSVNNEVNSVVDVESAVIPQTTEVVSTGFPKLSNKGKPLAVEPLNANEIAPIEQQGDVISTLKDTANEDKPAVTNFNEAKTNFKLAVRSIHKYITNEQIDAIYDIARYDGVIPEDIKTKFIDDVINRSMVGAKVDTKNEKRIQKKALTNTSKIAAALGNLEENINFIKNSPSESVVINNETDYQRVMKELKDKKKAYTKSRKVFELTMEEQKLVNNLISGNMSLDFLDRPTVKRIEGAYDLQKEINDKNIAITIYQKKLKNANKAEDNKRLEDAVGIISNSDNFVDKGAGNFGFGLRYDTETLERNFYDVAGRVDGEKLVEKYVNPIQRNEAIIKETLKGYRNKLASLKLSKDESKVIQLILENKNKQINDMGMLELTKEPRVMDAVATLKEFYQFTHEEMNKALLRNGQKGIGKIKNYSPHFKDPKNDSVLAKIGELLGVKNLSDSNLPTDINGLTETFHPNKRFFKFGLQRLGNNTDIDAIRGFELYAPLALDVIYHMDDVKNIRMLEKAIRWKYSGDNIRQQIEEILADDTKSEDVKEATIEELNTPQQLSGLVVYLKKYGDMLAGKSTGSRQGEKDFNRSVYQIAHGIRMRTTANMVGFNVSSALTNFLPISQVLIECEPKHVKKALKSVLASFQKEDGFKDKSIFLKARQDVAPISMSDFEKVLENGGAFFKSIDEFTSQVVVRSKFYQQKALGKNDDTAMNIADKYASRLIGDRSKGSIPLVFADKSFLKTLFTTFQLEVNNFPRYLIKDLPRHIVDYADDLDKEYLKRLSYAVVRFAISQFIANEIYKKIMGRRIGLDPIGLVVDSANDIKNSNLKNSDKVNRIATRVAQEVPFVGGYLGGGRLPISSSLPIDELKDSLNFALDGNSKMSYNKLGKAVGKASLLLLPAGGNQIKKTIEGAGALLAGGDYQETAKGRKLRYKIAATPTNIVKTLVFGKNSTKSSQAYFDGAKGLNERQTAIYDKLGKPDYKKYVELLKKAKLIKGKERSENIAKLINNYTVNSDDRILLYDLLNVAEKSR